MNIANLTVPLRRVLDVDWKGHYARTRQGAVIFQSRIITPGERKTAMLSLIEPGLLVVMVLLGLFLLLSLFSAGGEWLAGRSLHRTYAQLTGIDPAAIAAQVAQRDEMIKRMTSNRLIMPPPEFQLTGVLGDQAIFNGGMPLKAGQSAGDMKILSVGPNWVEVEKDGEKQKLYVFQPMPVGGAMLGGRAGAATPSMSSRSSRRTGGSPKPPMPTAAPAGEQQ